MMVKMEISYERYSIWILYIASLICYQVVLRTLMLDKCKFVSEANFVSHGN
jgi:hypothetical protein